MQLWELIARESIRDLVARYNANGDSGRWEPMLELFAENATMELPTGSYRGAAEIRGVFEAVAKKGDVKFIRHFTATHQIDVISEHDAKGRSYYAVLTDRGLDHWGRYVDDYRRIDGRWLFWNRKVTTDGSVAGSWADGVAQ